eukprot:6756802-Prymnesium_polylepis.2
MCRVPRRGRRATTPCCSQVNAIRVHSVHCERDFVNARRARHGVHFGGVNAVRAQRSPCGCEGMNAMRAQRSLHEK